MAKNPLIVFTPSGRRGRFSKGTPLLAAARALGVDLDTVCGGRGICGRCQIVPSLGEFPKHGIRVDRNSISGWNSVEARYKSKREMGDDRRLGCQAQVLSDLVVDVPPESQVHRQVVRKSAEARPLTLDAATRLHYVCVEEPDMNNPRGDLERVREALLEQWGIEQVTIGSRLLSRIQYLLRNGDWSITCAIHTEHKSGAARILEIWPGFYEETVFGLAVDVGSTTIACHLTSLSDGEVKAATGIMNPQIRFGEDLMSRVSYAMLNEGGAADMTLAVREAINAASKQACDEAGIETGRILEVVLVGNPVMHHLLLGLDPVELGGAPFALATGSAISLAASGLGLHLHEDARAYVLPCVAGHVGADCAAVVLSEAPQRGTDLTLIVDVGTNAEIVLGDQNRLLACSSPTGPAFEGAQISAGQRAAPGAIERVRIDKETLEPRFRVIGGDLWSDEAGFGELAGAVGVTGICGSGIIEAIAEMRMAGIVDMDGRINGALAERSSRVYADDRTYSYLLHCGEPRIAVTQNDVRAIQLAKAALYAGARLLMDRLEVEEVDRVVLAGAFGAHISPLHAAVLGMIPDCSLEKVVSAGNAAGTGARIALVNRKARREIEKVVETIEKIETAVEPRFQEHFVSAMAIPHKTADFFHLAQTVALPVERADDRASRRNDSRRRRKSPGR